MTEMTDGSAVARHTAPADDGYSRPVAELKVAFGDDVFEQPDLYGGYVDDELISQLRAAVEGAATPVTLTIYRAVPEGISEIRHGDWVTLSAGYARQHAMRDDDPDHDWPVITARVPSSLVFTDGNDLAECGYVGNAISATRLAGS